MAKKEMRRPIESGCPDGFQYMHPAMVRTLASGNGTTTHDLEYYGMWLKVETPSGRSERGLSGFSMFLP